MAVAHPSLSPHDLSADDSHVAAEHIHIHRLSLTFFRNYNTLRINLSPAPVLVIGENGTGKTNILEAISLLVPGRGLRRADLPDLRAINHTGGWGVAADVITPDGLRHIGTGCDEGGTDLSRRLISIDQHLVRNQSQLADAVAMAWITPDMDRLLADSPSARRKFVDRLAYSFDPAHAGRVNRYEKAMRERLRILRDGPVDAAWLNALEDDMARTGVAIAAARVHMVQSLSRVMDSVDSAFPQAIIALVGLAETMLTTHPALLVEDALRAALHRHRDLDTQSGTTSIGPHRSDLAVTHRTKNCPAHLCSTGEQKALLITLMMAYVRVVAQVRGMMPLLLLDDIAAHLDDVRRAALFADIRTLGLQAWVTGTDRDDFTALTPFAQILNVKGNGQ